MTIRTEIAEIPDIWADAGQFQQVLSHLIENAEHAMSAAAERERSRSAPCQSRPG